MQAKLKSSALILIVLFSIVLAAGNYLVLARAPFGSCWIGSVTPSSGEVSPQNPSSSSSAPHVATFLFGTDLLRPSCANYMYYFVGAPLIVGLLLLLILPNLVTREEAIQEAKPIPAQPEARRVTPPPPPPKPTMDAAVQLLALFQREGRLVDFLREDIQPYDDAQIGAAVREIHKACRQILAEHMTLEPVLNGHEGDDVTVPKDFDPSAIRLTGNVSGEPPFRGSLRHAGWQVVRVKLPAQPSGQDAKIVAPAEVEIP